MTRVSSATHSSCGCEQSVLTQGSWVIYISQLQAAAASEEGLLLTLVDRPEPERVARTVGWRAPGGLHPSPQGEPNSYHECTTATRLLQRSQGPGGQ